LEIFFRFSPINQSYTKNFPKKTIAPLKHYQNPTFKAIKTMYTFLALFLQKIYHPLPEYIYSEEKIANVDIEL